MNFANVNNLSLAKINAELARQDSVLKTGVKSEDLAKIKQVSQDFESIFLEIVLKSMRDSIPKSEIMDGGNAEDIFRTMLDGEYAKQLAKQGSSGIGSVIEKQLLEVLKAQSDRTQREAGIQAYNAGAK